MSIVGRQCSMPIETLSVSSNTDYLIATSTSQETLQLIDSQRLKMILNERKTKSDKRRNNSFFADLELDEPTFVDNQQEKLNDDTDSDEDNQRRKPPKKKKKQHNF